MRKLYFFKRHNLGRKKFNYVSNKNLFKPSSFSIKIKFYQILIFLLFLALFYFLFFFDYFQIKKTIIINQKFISEDEINKIINPVLTQKRFLIFPGRNVFLVNSKIIKNSLLENIPQIDSVEITKKYPDILKIKINEIEPKVLWQTKDQYYLVDKEGVVRSKFENYLDDPQISDLVRNLFKIIDQSGKDIQLKENVIFTKHINFIEKLYEKLPTLGINIKEIILPSPQAFELHVITDKNFKILFIIEKSIDAQLFNLKLVLEKELQNKTDDLEYIDLRVENWVYYKRKSFNGKNTESELTKISEEKEKNKNEQSQ